MMQSFKYKVEHITQFKQIREDKNMKFFTIRDLRTSPKDIWQSLSQSGEVVLTNNGKPTALMLNIEGGNLEEMLAVIHQASAMRAVNNIRMSAIKSKLGFLSDEDIQREIDAAREGL